VIAVVFYNFVVSLFSSLLCFWLSGEPRLVLLGLGDMLNRVFVFCNGKRCAKGGICFLILLFQYVVLGRLGFVGMGKNEWGVFFCRRIDKKEEMFHFCRLLLYLVG
jgi:hypothetical protein